MKLRHLLCVLSLCSILPALTLAQPTPTPALSKKDTDEIRYLAKRKIEKNLTDLLNTLTFEDIGEFERDALIKNSYLPNANQVFFNDEVVLEDDIEPTHRDAGNVVDVPVEKYLRNMDLFYTKTPSPSISFSNLVVSPVQMGDGFPYVKVFYTSNLKSKHAKLNQPYQPTSRVAELRAEKANGRWQVFINRLAFLRPGEGLAKLSKAPVTTTPAAATASAFTATSVAAALTKAPAVPASFSVVGPEETFRQVDLNYMITLKRNRKGLHVLKSDRPTVVGKGIYMKSGTSFLTDSSSITFNGNDRFRFVNRRTNDFVGFERVKIPATKAADTTSKNVVPVARIDSPKSIIGSTAQPTDTVASKRVVSAISSVTSAVPTDSLANIARKMVTEQIAKKAKEKPQPSPVLRKNLSSEQKKLAARYRIQGWLSLVAGVGGLVGGYLVYTNIQNDYKAYTTKVDALNADYDVWREVSPQQTGQRMAPMSLGEYGSPGIYAAYGAGAVGLGLTLTGVTRLLKAGRVGRK